MENTEVTETKKFNKANLPYFIALVFVILSPILLILALGIPAFKIQFIITSSLFILFIALVYVVSPIGLIFQILHKNKTKFDKIILTLNSIGIIFSYLLIIFIFLAFPNDFVDEKDVRTQIDNEILTLNNEYKPVLDYLAKYKKEHGVYPESLDDKLLPKSKIFEMYKYHTSYDGKGYWLQVYPKKGPIEYYYNDENDNGYNYYNGDGYIDGFLDNDYYYEIDDKWHAIMLQPLTRHSVVWNGGHTERETDEWMKTNADKFEKAEIEVKQKHEKVK